MRNVIQRALLLSAVLLLIPVMSVLPGCATQTRTPVNAKKAIVYMYEDGRISSILYAGSDYGKPITDVYSDNEAFLEIAGKNSTTFIHGPFSVRIFE